MKRGSILIVLVMTATASLGARRQVNAPVNAADPDTVKLEQEVDALTTLNDLALTQDQVSQLKGMVSDTAGTMADEPTPIADDYRTALTELRRALLSDDKDRIEHAQDRADDLQDQQDPDSDAMVDQSDSAKEKAAPLLKILSAKQVANLISENADDVDNPLQLLLDAVHHVNGMAQSDFESLRDDTADRIGALFGFSHPGKPLPVVMKVNRLLIRAHHLSAADYQSQQSSLEDEAKQIVGSVDPIFCLRHWTENTLADLLSNPEVGQALSDLGGTTAK